MFDLINVMHQNAHFSMHLPNQSFVHCASKCESISKFVQVPFGCLHYVKSTIPHCIVSFLFNFDSIWLQNMSVWKSNETNQFFRCYLLIIALSIDENVMHFIFRNRLATKKLFWLAKRKTWLGHFQSNIAKFVFWLIEGAGRDRMQMETRSN